MNSSITTTETDWNTVQSHPAISIIQSTNTNGIIQTTEKSSQFITEISSDLSSTSPHKVLQVLLENP